jgi:hypothetical protein
MSLTPDLWAAERAARRGASGHANTATMLLQRHTVTGSAEVLTAAGRYAALAHADTLEARDLLGLAVAP